MEWKFLGDDEARPNLSFSFSVEIFVFEFKFVYIDLLEGRPTDADNVYFSEAAAAGILGAFRKANLVESQRLRHILDNQIDRRRRGRRDGRK